MTDIVVCFFDEVSQSHAILNFKATFKDAFNLEKCFIADKLLLYQMQCLYIYHCKTIDIKRTLVLLTEWSGNASLELWLF